MRVLITKAAYDLLPQRLKDQLPAAPTEGATMKDSHGQTVQPSCAQCHKQLKRHSLDWVAADGTGYCNKTMTGQHLLPKPPESTIVQDYREYTEREILLGILDFSRRTGWGDPANLGHWLGAAQRWAKERAK